ncbi:hypothetical protein [Alteromonas naphthalenivorans]|uniref:Uncharacterized protein n=1 Tax=Alteromonas naphthalenivorans TaxID=715451 RepID=F5Z659_ALTNA|nr:hypothetical protein [Alteromonas naphthalenivorans]AEF05292.1 hypothetical protein ambt_18995 [Alteromonas naphthalenivorans]
MALAYCFIDSEPSHSETKRASVALQSTNVQPVVSNNNGNAGRLIKIEVEPGTFYLTIEDKNGVEQTLATSSLNRASLSGAPSIGDEIRWETLTKDHQLNSKYLDKSFEHITFVRLEPLLPINGTVQKVSLLTNEAIIYVSVLNTDGGQQQVMLKGRKGDLPDVQYIKKGTNITWKNAALLSISRGRAKPAVVAISSLKVTS